MKESSSNQQLLTLEDASGTLGGISPWTLRRWISAGAIKAVHIGRRVFLHADTVAKIAQSGLPSLPPAAK